ncbi:stAR-related lipid transfer 7, mitochondrial [Olea europaea subsp. europaea]|uniref:StAR-related lipid transfer 7, mitochondrial n=1 Tax=Olea europaea subsp. europaea TaxID=158383 RepID=A0A8S0REB2_OLEEU|nr:stAR-related lipid transfer 7, mitochondrial [Olea europaea subsp. europaea]
MWGEDFWREDNKMKRGSLPWTWTLAVLLLIFTLNFLRFRFRFVHLCFRNQKPAHSNPVTNCVSDSISSPLSQDRISGIISDLDLKNLIDDLDEKFHEDIIWENVIDKSNNRFSYKAQCCKQKDGPLKYLSVTTFENCSIEVLMKYYMDNDYRKLWDKTVVEHEQLQVDQASGTEIGRTVKKFPFLTPREYVLAWRVWQGKDGSFYCFSKESEHPLAPRQRRYIRVKLFRSGWRIRKVPGRNACEIKMVHQEDAGLNVEMAKLAFAKGIWSYVRKMSDALREYSTTNQLQLNSAVPPEFEILDGSTSTVHPENLTLESNAKRLSRMPSNKLIRNGLIVVGGVLCLSRGHSSLGAKVAMACILSKFTKRGSSSNKAGKVH